MKRKCLAVGIILLLIVTTIIPSNGQKIEKQSPPGPRGNILYVGGSGPGNYTKIQDAINASSDGDTIFVYDDSSPYYEAISVDKSIALVGEHRNTTILDGSGYHYVINVTSDNVTIYNFTIQNKGYNRTFDTLQILGNRCTILQNNIIKNAVGIQLSNSKRCNITNNYILSSKENIGIGDSLKIRVQGNILVQRYNDTIPDAPPGISIANSMQNIIINNTLYNNSFVGINLYESDDNLIRGNVFYNNSAGILDTDSVRNSIQNNFIRSCSDCGILLLYASNSYIIDNDIADCHYGIKAQASDQTYIFDNSITSNKGYGINFAGCERNYVYQNIIKDNCFGMFILYKSNGNVIYYNSFIKNEFQAYDACNNTWNCSYPSAGNYWDDYHGADINNDGIGDTPYNISGGSNQDHYPLMLPFGITKLSITIQPKNFRLLLFIKNIGNTTAFNVKWNMTIDGFVLFGKQSSGFASRPLLPEHEILYTSNTLFIGLGRIEITATAWAENAPVVTAKMNGILILWFFRVIGR